MDHPLNRQRFKRMLWAGLLLGAAAAAIGVFFLRRPPRSDRMAELFEGVVYRRWSRSAPRPLMIHLIKIDLESTTGLIVTPGDVSQGMEVTARTTSAFARQVGAQVAINGSFFEPFEPGRFLWDYYPHVGDPVDVIGLAVSDGQVYSDHDPRYPAFCVLAQRAEIRPTACPTNTLQALAGRPMLVQDGHSLVQHLVDEPEPRTVVAIDATGQTIWFIVIDGRQPDYSEGATLAELANIAMEVGADRALNLDGGGSSALVFQDRHRVRLLNAPVHKRIPMWERPVANHLGVYARPLTE